MPFDKILKELTYENLIMYNSVIPSFNNQDEGLINGDDPANQDLLNKKLYE